jgi:hypothetical protein
VADVDAMIIRSDIVDQVDGRMGSRWKIWKMAFFRLEKLMSELRT